ncbi:MAG: hypothetical protein ACRDYC_11460 [Acidimicrobiales bacterium]
MKVAPRVTLELLVLGVGGNYFAGVDRQSGALVRAWSEEPADHELAPFDLVSVTVADDQDALPDPAEPEALVLRGAPERSGRLSPRRAEKLLRPLLHPPGQPLLGTHAPAVPFWERSPDHPSITLVEPEGSIVMRREVGFLSCSFRWQGAERELPCLDSRLAADMDSRGRTRATAPRGARLLISLTPPIDGHCHKVVETVLPRR